MSPSTNLKKLYYEALALPKVDVSSPSISAQKAALARAHELRKFEIENYWKRATYFWAFQLASFTLLGLLWKETVGTPPSLNQNALMIPAGLGAITGLVGWMTARGSKFWQQNWEWHVDMLETSLEGRLTQLVLDPGGTQFSVSRVNEKLLFVITAGWFAFFLGIVVLPMIEVVPDGYQRVFGVVALCSVCAFIFEGARTRLSGMASNGLGWKRLESWSLRKKLRECFNQQEPKPQLILRDTLAGKATACEITKAEEVNQ